MRRRRVRTYSATALAVGLLVATASTSNAFGQSSGHQRGLARSEVTSHKPFRGPTSSLKPFNPNAPAGLKPPTHVPRVAAWEAQSTATLWLQYTNGIRQSLQGSGIQLLTGNADADPTTMVSALRSFLQRGVGALITVPVGGNQPLTPIEQQAIGSGAYVTSELAGPAQSVITVDQYNVGFVQGKAAAQYIDSHLHGKASVLYFNANNVSPLLIPREKGALAGLRTGGSGIQVVDNISITPDVTQGEQDMSTALQAHPDINVVLGDDESVLGAVHAYQSLGKISSLAYASGVDGSPDALAAIQAGSTPYKVDYGFNYGVMGYVNGQMIRRWFAGKSVPMVMDFKPAAMNSAATINAYNRAASKPKSANVAAYVSLLGTISYGSRSSYVDYSP